MLYLSNSGRRRFLLTDTKWRQTGDDGSRWRWGCHDVATSFNSNIQSNAKNQRKNQRSSIRIESMFLESFGLGGVCFCIFLVCVCFCCFRNICLGFSGTVGILKIKIERVSTKEKRLCNTYWKLNKKWQNSK